jgi:hypothetical protein
MRRKIHAYEGEDTSHMRRRIHAADTVADVLALSR